ncbi:hypothetical protein ACS0TY_031191 [Phlomoides rotata]
MVGEMRSRAKYYQEMARKAVEEGGSSYTSLNALIEELSTYETGLELRDFYLLAPLFWSQFFRALELLQQPVETILQELQPNSLISDVFLPWTSDSAAKLGIPRLFFQGTSYFERYGSEQMELHKPFKNVPNLPHQLTFVRTQVSEAELREDEDDGNDFMKMRESEKRSYGEVINSFYELESDYVDHYKNVLGKRAWNIGPLPLCNNGAQDKFSQRGKQSAIDQHECLAWLESKRPNSVVYVCFGSTAKFTPPQLHETAVDFIWVVRRGAFVTHCGWNSTLEGISVGVPMLKKVDHHALIEELSTYVPPTKQDMK